MNISRSCVDKVIEDMREAYLGDSRPWIVGFSGGKDSTMIVQLLYYMLANMNLTERHKHVYVLASDTRVEAPSIRSRIRKEIAMLAASAERDGLPITTHLVYPNGVSSLVFLSEFVPGDAGLPKTKPVTSPL